MTPAEMREATGLGPEWGMVCVGHGSALMHLGFAAAETPGIDVAT